MPGSRACVHTAFPGATRSGFTLQAPVDEEYSHPRVNFG